MKSSAAALRIAVAVGVGAVAHTVNPGTGDVAQAYAQVAGNGTNGECLGNDCGTPGTVGGGSACGSGSSIMGLFFAWLGF
jgi:hypothetical protein